MSQAGGPPSAFITWFQAQQACRNVGKRLLANAEWQAAAAGTPDSSDCNILASGVAATGSLASCVSRWGVFDMVGNVSIGVGGGLGAALDGAVWELERVGE